MRSEPSTISPPYSGKELKRWSCVEITSWNSAAPATAGRKIPIQKYAIFFTSSSHPSKWQSQTQHFSAPEVFAGPDLCWLGTYYVHEECQIRDRKIRRYLPNSKFPMQKVAGIGLDEGCNRGTITNRRKSFTPCDLQAKRQPERRTDSDEKPMTGYSIAL